MTQRYSEYLQYVSDHHENEEPITRICSSSLSNHTEESRDSKFLFNGEEISYSGIFFKFCGEESDDESDNLSPLTKTEDQNAELSDEEYFENGVYLEYADSDNESVDSEFEKSNSLLETSSITESVELDPDKLQSLVESLDKTSKFPHCDVCNIHFRTLEQLIEHRSCHDCRKIVTCEVCKNIIHKDFYKLHLRVHRESYNQRLAKKYRKSKCTVCSKNVSKVYMKTHLLKHGTAEEKAKRLKNCTICDVPIFAPYLTEHMKRVHMQHKESKAKRPTLKIICPICSRTYLESTYERHVASHARTLKKFVCEECGKEFFSPSTFKTHLLTHKQEYKYKCQFCPYRGKHLGLLKVHVRTHTKDYLYKCTVCNASFLTKSNLTAHQKTHFPQDKFICAECGKCFSRERTLENHTVSVHEGIKAFVCDICWKSYGSKFVLAAHKKRVHKVVSLSRKGRMPSYLLAAKENEIENESLDLQDNSYFYEYKYL